ncbi:MAG: YciI family protein [Gemmatimonadales bacterium]
MRASGNRRGSTFFRCARAEFDPHFARYPPLPVTRCAGYEEAMFFVVLMHYTGPLEAMDRVRAEHLAHLEHYAGRGIIHAWARRDPPTGGIFVATAPDRATLETIVAEDPYVRSGAARPEIVEFDPKNVRGVLQT